MHTDLTSAAGSRAVQASSRPTDLLAIAEWTAPTGAVVLAVHGEVDTSSCSVLHNRIDEQLRSDHHLVLDLGEVDLLCAAGLTVLVVVRERAQLRGTVLCVVARTRPVRLPLIITGLTGVLDLHLDVDEALACGRARLTSEDAVC
ncbi:STAS domain-containing protein [Lentzea sp. HUAS12]|uniref:STAS domain-containing protein n=1 Tax=Lentzea sp. HUAS12 TaxID=2951806 RepID=UPI00209DE48D|nr:STAS domain-containing protein [Lentzea sp. HUAS12]USX54043.1 STAS domain-containing protein [Lentzea sp. HUAS12]